MHRIKLTLKNKLWRFLLVLAIALPTALAAGVTDVQAGGAGPIPIIGIFAGVGRRNRVYRTAESFIDEKKQYTNDKIG